MPAISGSAPGKIILFGEHAVVYGYRAIAIPVTQVQARAVITPLIKSPAGTIQIIAPDILLDTTFAKLDTDHPIRRAIHLTLTTLELTTAPAMQIRIQSDIPLAGGLGSGAAVSVAIIRAVSTYLGKKLNPEIVSEIAYEVEKIHHGTPSGIDNAVIAYGMPVIYQKGKPIQTFQPGSAFTFLIADTGIKATTAEIVRGVRERWQADPVRYEKLFKDVDSLTGQAVLSLKAGDVEMTGRWMTENHALLQRMGVSSPELDQLVSRAMLAGAKGAKLSGAGNGGNMIALVEVNQVNEISAAMLAGGATRVIHTRLE